MSRTRLSPVDILGITLGVICALIVIGSIVAIASGRMFDVRWSIPEGRGLWDGESFSFGANVREEKDELVEGAFTELEVRNVAGSIEVSSASASGFAVHYVKTGPSQAALDGVRMDVQKRGNRLVLEEKHEPGIMARRGTISFSIAIPASVKVIEARSVSGSITVRDIPAGIDQTLSTISGSIRTSKARNLDASSTSGQISFAFAGQRLDARSVSGSIDGNIEALDTGGTARMNTVSGSVSLRAWSGLDATVSLRSLSGRVSCDFPITVSEQKNNRLSGKIGSGAASVDAGTTSGSITIGRL
jgi:hypothetical protein